MARPVVLITGAGGGLGRALAGRFAADGYAVGCAGRDLPALQRMVEELGTRGGEAAAVACDVTDRAAVHRAVATIETLFGPIDVLVNNAGVAESAAFTTMDDELWDRTIAVNLTGTYNCTRAVAPGMFARRRGRIINIASTAARQGYSYTTAYVASKHGVLGLTRALALEARSRGVTVNALCPGWIETPMTARTIARIVETTGRSPEEARQTLAGMNPQGRLITPDEVAAVAAYLASPAAADVNGLDVDVP